MLLLWFQHGFSMVLSGLSMALCGFSMFLAWLVWFYYGFGFGMAVLWF